MGPNHRRRELEQGAALILALGALALFAMLGFAYISFMLNQQAVVANNELKAQAREAAAAGITNAIESIRQARANSQEPPSTYNFRFPLYMQSRQEDGTAANVARSKYDVRIAVSISDENARLNINHASSRMLQTVLGVDGPTAQKIQTSLPRGAGNKGTWFAHVDDLFTRGLITNPQFDALNKDMLTVYTVLDQTKPVAYLNVNTMPVELLAALLVTSVEEAAQVASKRPFSSLEEIAAAAGKAPDAFALRRGADVPVIGSELCFTSNCYRITVEAQMYWSAEGEVPARDVRGGGARAEAVVVFDQLRSAIVYWNVLPMRVTARSGESAGGEPAMVPDEETPAVPEEPSAEPASDASELPAA